jgi:hypothetical protein
MSNVRVRSRKSADAGNATLVNARRIRRICVNTLICMATIVAACSGDSERILRGRVPERVLLYNQQRTSPPNKYSGSETRTDSIWLYNAELTSLGKQRFRVWIEQEWYNNPPPQFGDNPMSERILFETDCSTGLYREGHNTGEVPSMNDPWKAPPPRSVRKAYLDSLCLYLKRN